MLLLDRTLVSSYGLSIVTKSLSAVVWPQFAMQIFHLTMFVETVSCLFTDTRSSMISILNM